MRELANKIVVLGHYSPDADSAAAACAYAELLKRLRRYPQPTFAAVPQPLASQALFLFQRSGLRPPRVIHCRGQDHGAESSALARASNAGSEPTPAAVSSTYSRRVILIDHAELMFDFLGAAGTHLLEIVDHHPVRQRVAEKSPLVNTMPVGSSCTIVASEYFRQGVALSPDWSLLLLGGILANTLLLKGPTTTLTDQRIAEQLARIAEVDLALFGKEVLRAGDDFGIAAESFRWDHDRKEFRYSKQTLAILQLQTTRLPRIPTERLDQLAKRVRVDHQASGRLLTLLMLTDVLLCQSWMYGCEDESARGVIRAALPGSEPHTGWLHAAGVVSRSGQVVPRILDALRQREIGTTLPTESSVHPRPN